MHERFLKSNRLTGAAAFARVFKKAERSRDNVFTVLCRANEANDARLGLAIAKKHCRLATDRNRLKRLIRESFRRHKAGLAGLDIVVLNRRAAAQANNEQLFKCLESHWQRCRNAVPGEVGKH